MRLLNTSTVQLAEDLGNWDPRGQYAILSHTWEQEEVSFVEFQQSHDAIRHKAGYQKIQSFCKRAAELGFKYAWTDTACIDQQSSAELTEAINRMYQWYHDAGICLIYLSDIPGSSADSVEQIRQLRSSRWFMRGWTLQELVASQHREFYAQDWTLLETTKDQGQTLIDTVSHITHIKKSVLQERHSLQNICIAERMSWASARETSRPEDIAYSLMGLFNVSMPILYGEGERSAFKRLQLEIMKESFDQTIFAWRGSYGTSGLLAKKPSDFHNIPELGLWSPIMLSPFTMTNLGLSIRMPFIKNPLTKDQDFDYVALQCDVKVSGQWKVLLLALKQVEGTSCAVNGKVCKAYRRVRTDHWASVRGLNTNEDYCEDVLVLEDGHSELVQQSIQSDYSRWASPATSEGHSLMSEWFHRQPEQKPGGAKGWFQALGG